MGKTKYVTLLEDWNEFKLYVLNDDGSRTFLRDLSHYKHRKPPYIIYKENPQDPTE